MNALRPMILRSAAAQAARQSARSKATVAARPGAVPPQLNYNFQKEWLSDPSTYPIILVMSCGMTFLFGMSCNALFGYKDVQLSPSKRCSSLTTWGQEVRTPITERVAKSVGGGVKPEGLGVDHDEWAKNKAEYMKK